MGDLNVCRMLSMQRKDHHPEDIQFRMLQGRDLARVAVSRLDPYLNYRAILGFATYSEFPSVL